MTTSISLKDIMCADPVEGTVYRHLFNGGSWFDAEQVHWQIIYTRTCGSLGDIVNAKPSKSNVERAMMLLGTLKEATNQLVPSTDYMPGYTRAESAVAKWSAPPSQKPTGKGFMALADSENED